MSATKIVDLIAQPSDRPHISLEYFPPRTEDGVKNLKARMARMKDNVNPLFTDITWGAGGSTSGLSMDLGIHLQTTGHTSNLHMTCTNIQGSADPVADIRTALQQAKDAGIRNIVALRGDPPAGEEEWKATEGGFSCALDLVKFMKQEFGDSFGISVAGYPEGHPNAISKVEDVSKLTPAELARSSTCEGETFTCLDADYKKEMDYLKEKIDAGGDVIITQMFFDVAVYHQFVTDCRAIGIKCPIVPGLMCLTAKGGFLKMTKFCKTRVPTSIMERVQAADDVKTLGVDIGTEMCQDLLSGPEPPSVLHFYTLNLEKVVYGILQKLGYMKVDVEMNEADAASQVATGSAWARVGDAVHSVYGKGVVTHLDPVTAAARVEISNWELANQQKPVAFLQKGHYKKTFA